MNEAALISSLQSGLISWYDFRHESCILYIGDKRDDIASYLLRISKSVSNKSESHTFSRLDITVASLEESVEDEFVKGNKGTYDYLICIEKLESAERPIDFLNAWKLLMKPDGICILGMNNRLGAHFFCGDSDPYTKRPFDGIEGYRKINLQSEDSYKGRCYAKYEIEDMLYSAGFEALQFFSVIPGLHYPSILLSYGYKPKEDLANRVFPVYETPGTVFLEEESIYSSLIENDMFHQMANAYFIEAAVSKERELSSALQITSSSDRGAEDAMITVVRNDNTVEKRNVYPEGRKRLEDMMVFAGDLRRRGIDVIEFKLTDRGLIMPYIDAPTGQLYLKGLINSDREAFIKKMDLFRDLIIKSSEVIAGEQDDDEGLTLKYGYLDMVPLNSFYVDDRFVFFDQEFRVEGYPVNAIISRMIMTFYAGNSEFEKIIPLDDLYKRYGMFDRKMYWLQMEWDFLRDLRSEDELRDYHQKIRRNPQIVNSNRDRMNYSHVYYNRTYMNIFEGIEGKTLFLFGAGKYTDRFLEMYGDDFPVCGILDNDIAKHGTLKRGIRIYSPNELRKEGVDSCKVMVCMKDYGEAVKQLEDMGVTNYSVYDPNRYYATRPRTSIRIIKDSGQADLEEKTAADYHCHIGYCAGAFDMFHIGHLNLLRRAKERCDYLIVGVMSDERMYDLKKKYPIIPCNERMQVVAGCRYVDRVEELPADRAGIMDAWNMFHFDCMFSGDDHADNPDWLAERERLRERGSDIVFVSYTKEQSSSAIREQMRTTDMEEQYKL